VQYNLDAVAFESVLVGLFTIMTGKYCASGGGVNRTGEWDQVFVGFSRDGVHWFRPTVNEKHVPFLRMNDSIVRRPSDDWPWNKAMVQSVGGGFTVANDGTDGHADAEQLAMRFYASGRGGVDQLSGWPVKAGSGSASTSVAEMRRDGFASLRQSSSAAGLLVTRLIEFSPSKTVLFINADGADGLTISVQDARGMPLPGLAAGDFRGTAETNGTRLAVRWAGGTDALRVVAGRPVRFTVRFASRSAALYSFWVASDECGASQGWVAAGGRGFNASIDRHGSCR
jgi:hypothetical protein